MGRYTSIANTEIQQTNNWSHLKFNKGVIGIERNNIIVKGSNILKPEDIEIIPESLEAIKLMRLKGYEVCIFFNEPNIGLGIISEQDVNVIMNKLMEYFGQYGIYSISGALYSTTNMRSDLFAMPHTGMMKKFEQQNKVSFKKNGYFIGDKFYNLKAGFAVGATPILIKTGDYEETLNRLNLFTNKKIKQKTKIFDNLLDFANTL